MAAHLRLVRPNEKPVLKPQEGAPPARPKISIRRQVSGHFEARLVVNTPDTRIVIGIGQNPAEAVGAMIVEHGYKIGYDVILSLVEPEKP